MFYALLHARISSHHATKKAAGEVTSGDKGPLFEGVRAEVKFFLIKFFATYGLENSVRAGIAKLVDELELPTNTIRKSIGYFARKGYLEASSVSLKKGQAPGLYTCSPSLKKILDNLNHAGLPLPHRALIEDLFATEKHKADGDRHPLGPAHRLLLSVMLSNADSCGVVSTLGASDLRMLTGASDDRLGTLLDTLLNEGYIRFKVPGITHKHLFARAKGIYYLNLKHVKYGVRRRTGVTTLFTFCFRYGDDHTQNHHPLLRRLSHASHSTTADGLMRNLENWLGWQHSTDEIFKFFTGLGGRDPRWFFIMSRIRGYASYLLSIYSSTYGVDDTTTDFEKEHHALKIRICREVFNREWPNDSAAVVATSPLSAAEKTLVELFFRFAWTLGEELLGALSKQGRLVWRDMDYVILPPQIPYVGPSTTAIWRSFVAVDGFERNDSDPSPSLKQAIMNIPEMHLTDDSIQPKIKIEFHLATQTRKRRPSAKTTTANSGKNQTVNKTPPK